MQMYSKNLFQKREILLDKESLATVCSASKTEHHMELKSFCCTRQ